MAHNTLKSIPVQGQVVYYRSDGTGRDTYIQKMNGGLRGQDLLQKLEPIGKNVYAQMSFTSRNFRNGNPPAFENQVTHYHSDGSGRDSYIQINDGGRSRDPHWRSHVDQRFNSSLRQYDQIPPIGYNQTFYETAQYFRPNTSVNQTRQLSMQQTNLNERLATPQKVSYPTKLLMTMHRSKTQSNQFLEQNIYEPQDYPNEEAN